jgi:hypothetical protein
MPEHGLHTVTVPGAVSGWWVARGPARFEAAFETAVGCRRRRAGLRTLAEDLHRRPRGDRSACRVTVAGLPPKVSAQLARATLERVAAGHARSTAARSRVIGAPASLGSAMTIEDLGAHEPGVCIPLTIRYRDLVASVLRRIARVRPAAAAIERWA